MSLIKQAVGSGIRLIRKSKGISQEILADAAGVSPSYMGEVERGLRNISIETLEKIADGLTVMPIDILRASSIQGETEQSVRIQVLEKHIALMAGRGKQEIELIHKIARDIFTYSDHG